MKLLQKATFAVAILSLAVAMVLPSARVNAVSNPEILRNLGTNECMSVSNYGIGASIVQQRCDGSADKQLWLFAPTGGTDSSGFPTYRIKVFYHQSWCLAIDGGSYSIGARLVLWPCSEATTNNFIFGMGGGTSVIRALHSGQFLQVNGGPTSGPGAGISQWTLYSGLHFYWTR